MKQKITKNTYTSVQEDPFLPFSLLPEWSPKTPLWIVQVEIPGPHRSGIPLEFENVSIV
jgi:hypothetical protein